MPQFIDRHRGHLALQLALLGGTFMVIDLATDVAIGLLATVLFALAASLLTDPVQ